MGSYLDRLAKWIKDSQARSIIALIVFVIPFVIVGWSCKVLYDDVKGQKDRKIKELKTKIEGCENKNREFEQKIDDLNEKNREMSYKIELLSGKILNKDKLVEELNEDTNRLTIELASKNTMIMDLSGKCSSLENINNALEKANENNEVKVASCKEQLSNLRRKWGSRIVYESDWMSDEDSVYVRGVIRIEIKQLGNNSCIAYINGTDKGPMYLSKGEQKQFSFGGEAFYFNLTRCRKKVHGNAYEYKFRILNSI